jgi:hypothetical protein
MVDVVGNGTYRGCMPRAAGTGDALDLAGTVFAGLESRVCSELRPVGEP